MLLSWHYITSAAYKAASVSDKTSDKLFFLSDTKEIYRGTESFTESVILYTTLPDAPAVGKLYINSTTLEGRVWNGSTWTTVINAVADTVTADGKVAVSGAAVASYVADEIAKVTGSSELVTGVAYAEATNTLTVSMADDTTKDIPLTGVAADLKYDATTGKLEVVNAAGTVIGEGINLDLERFIESAEYDADTQTIVLTFNDSTAPLKIPVGALVDTYTAKNSTSIALTVTGNEFVAEAIVSEGAGNMLSIEDDGLFVAAVDISGKVDKVASATAGDIATLTADGGIQDSKVKIGGAALADAPNASTLATEAAVNAVVATLNASINTKMAKVGAGHENEIIIADADGDAKASGSKVGGATFDATPNAATLATEKGVTTYVEGYSVAKANVVAAGDIAASTAAASDDKVVSEKAIVDAMTWKTTV